jgi:transposase
MERKVRYDYAFKLECVKLVLEKHYSCNMFQIKKPNESNIRKWVEFYSQYDSGLLPRKNQSYSVNFKLKVLRQLKNLMSLRDSSLKLTSLIPVLLLNGKRFC